MRDFTGEQIAQVDNADPFAAPVWRSPVHRTPEWIIWLVQLIRLIVRVLWFLIRHPLLDAAAGLVILTWAEAGWTGVLVLASVVLEIHAPLRGAAVGTKTGSLPPGVRCGSQAAGGFRDVRAAAGGVEGAQLSCVPSVVAGWLWSVRGRVLDWRRSLLPGNPRCCCVRVCQSPVLIWGSGGRHACSHPHGGLPLQEVAAGMRVLHERVAGIDVHKDMIKVAVRSPGDKPWTRKTEILEFRTFYGVLQHMASELARRGVTHVVMEASGVYTEPVYYALCERDFDEVAVINPAHAKALKGHKTDARTARGWRSCLSAG